MENSALLAQLAGGNRDIVEEAEPLPMIGERMMRATGEISGDPVSQRGARGQQRASGGEPRAPPERLRPGKADPSLLRGGQAAGLQLFHVAAVVYVFAHRKAAAHHSLVLEMKAASHARDFGLTAVSCHDTAMNVIALQQLVAGEVNLRFTRRGG